MAGLTIKYLDWDSQQLGVHCGLIDCAEAKELTSSVILFNRIKALCEKKINLEFITIKLPDNCIEAVNLLVKMGAFLIDTELTFACTGKTASKQCAPVSNSLKFVFCKEYDSKAFIPLAKEMRLSRFFLDPNISKEKAVRLWKTSIRNHCEGFADQLLVAYNNGEPCGIVALKFTPLETCCRRQPSSDTFGVLPLTGFIGPKQIFLHIVGVLKKFQGSGIARLMLGKITERYAKNHTIFVETQSNNIAAQSVYQKSGFKFYGLKYVLHYWQ